MTYTIYYHTHDRNGYEHTEYLCFICASRSAKLACETDNETIHPISVKEGRGQRTECSACNRKLNWMDT